MATLTIEHKYPRLSDILVSYIKECSANIKGFFFQTANLDSDKQHNMIKGFYDFFDQSPELSKFRIAESDGEPVRVLRDILYGFDIIEAKFPFKLAKENRALCLNLNFPEDFKICGSELQFSKTVKSLNLKSEEFKLDQNPLSETSIIKQIHRSYIYHLIDCDELNSEILLTLHNVN